jgi:hypothetical protein
MMDITMEAKKTQTKAKNQAVDGMMSLLCKQPGPHTRPARHPSVGKRHTNGRPRFARNAHKKGGVVLSAYHATQGRRIVQTSICTMALPDGSLGAEEFFWGYFFFCLRDRAGHATGSEASSDPSDVSE